MARNPLDFVPAPIPAWRSQLPLIAFAAAGFIAFGAARLTRPEVGPHAAAASLTALADAHTGSAVKSPELPAQSPAEPGAADAPPGTEAEPSAVAAPGEGAAPGPGEAAPGEAAPGEAAPGEAASGDAAPRAAAAGEEGAPGVEPEVGEGGAPPKPMSPTALRRAERAAAGLRSAVQEGRVQAVADFFALVDVAEEAWDGAASRCTAARVDGVGNWKLASPGELKTLDRASKLPAGAYWSRSRSRKDPALAVAYDASEGRSVLWLTQEPNGAVVCTQARPRVSEQ